VHKFEPSIPVDEAGVLFDCDVASNALLQANWSLAETGKVFLREGNVSVCVYLMQFKQSQSPSFPRWAKRVCDRARRGGRERGMGQREIT